MIKDSSKFYTHKDYEIRGWFKDSERGWYKKHANNIKDGIIIEIGVYGGVSLLSIVEICQKNNTKIYGIDPWELLTNYNGRELDGDELTNYQRIMKSHRIKLGEIITKYGYDNVELLQGFSLDINKFDDESVDFVYIDANHSYNDTMKDIKKWFPKVKKGGVFSGDDYKWEGVKKAVDEFSKEKNLKVNVYENTWEILL